MTEIDSALVLRLAASLASFERQMAKARKAGSDTAVSIERQFDGMNKKMAGSAERSAKALTRHLDKVEGGYRSVVASVDPAGAAALRLAEQERMLGDALKYGTISAEEHARVMALVRAQYQATMPQIANGTVAAAGGMSRFVNVSSAGRFVLQNTANQIGDVAVQLQMGTSASRVAAQQLPQLLGGFGALGGALGLVAPLLGVVAAVGIPLGAMFLALGDDVEEATEKVETFEDKLDAARGAIDRAKAAMEAASRGGIEDLRSTFGEITREITEMADRLADIEIRAARVNLNALLDDATGEKFAAEMDKVFGDVGAALVSGTAEEAETIKGLIQDLNAEIATIRASGMVVPQGLMDQQRQLAEELAAVEGRFAEIGSLASDLTLNPQVLTDLAAFEERLKASRDAGDFGGVATAIDGIIRTLTEAGVEIDQGVIDNLTEAQREARRLNHDFEVAQGTAGQVAGAAGGITDEVGRAADRAADLTSNLRGALTVLASVTSGLASTQRRALAQAQIDLATVGDPVGRAGLTARLQFNEDTADIAYSMVRNGRAGQLAAEADRIEAGARELAEAEERLRAAEDALKESLRDSGDGGGRQGKGPVGFFDAIDRDLISLERQIEMLGKTEAQVAGLTAKYQLLDAARERGLDLDARQAESGQTLREQIDATANSLTELTERYNQAAEQADFFGQITDDLKTGIVDAILEADNFADALANVAKQLAAAALQAAIFGDGPLGGMASGQGGLLGGLARAIGDSFSGGGAVKAKSFAGGGFTGLGSRSGGLDGRGGFMAMLHPNETVIDHTRSSQGASMVINQSITVNSPSGSASDILAVLRPAMRSEAQQVFARARREGR
jgi:hypothetical protein